MYTEVKNGIPKKSKMILKLLIMVIYIGNYLLSANAYISNASNYRRRCNGTYVDYPFGFTSGCDFKLNCTYEGVMQFKGFTIRNISLNTMSLNISPDCTRPVSRIRELFGLNYAMNSRNVLLLENCSTPLTTLRECMVSKGLLMKGGFDRCSGSRENMSCYYVGNSFMRSGGVLRYEDFDRSECSVWVSSIVLDVSGNDGGGDALNDVSNALLKFQTVQVQWWMSGLCRCHVNASCVSVGATGFWCRCKEGFVGDGFIDGQGCHYATASIAETGRDLGTKVPVLIGVITAGAAYMAIMAVVLCILHRRSIILKSQINANNLLSEAADNTPVPLYPYTEIMRATYGFSENRRLGSGAYSTVYAGRLNNNDFVAIKRIKNRDTNNVEQVMNEIKLLCSVSHPNLVRLLGCCIENNKQILVFEYMPNGTLFQHLHREHQSGNALPWTVRLAIASETAYAISYLHSAMNPPIYHRDIKSSNILLDFNYKSKLADFGLSRLGKMDLSHVSTAPQGTPGYVDPQYHQNFHLSEKSDVYSFGVVLVEIITAMKVIDFNRPHIEVNLASLAIDRIGKGQVDEIIDPYIKHYMDAWTLASVHKVAELAFRCLAYLGDMRPTMMEVAHELEQIRRSGWGLVEQNMNMRSSCASYCSSPINGSKRSIGRLSMQKSMGSQRVVSQRAVSRLASLEERKDNSPVTVDHDPWFSDYVRNW